MSTEMASAQTDNAAGRPPHAVLSTNASTESAPEAGPSTATQASSLTRPTTAASDASDNDDDDDDDLDIFDSGLSSLFNVPPIGFSSSKHRPHVYTPPSTSGLPPVDVWTASPPAAVFSKLQAQHLWLAAVYLADKIATGVIRPRGSVLELGAGAGLPSVVTGLRRKADSGSSAGGKADATVSEGGEADAGVKVEAGGKVEAGEKVGAGGKVENGAEGGDVVVCTDYDDQTVIDNIARNVAAANSPVIVRGHSWGTPTDSLLALSPGGFSLILADTLWSTETHGILLDSVLSLLAQDGVAHIAAGLHTGRGPHDRFKAFAAERGLKMDKVEEVIYDCGEWKPHTAQGPGLEEERGVVIYYTLHR